VFVLRAAGCAASTPLTPSPVELPAARWLAALVEKNCSDAVTVSRGGGISRADGGHLGPVFRA